MNPSDQTIELLEELRSVRARLAQVAPELSWAALDEMTSVPPHSDSNRLPNYAGMDLHNNVLFASNPLPMYIVDIETLQFIAVNNAAVEHYGYSRAEFLAMTMADMRPQADVPALRQAMAQLDQTLIKAGVWRHYKKNGDLIFVEICAHAFLWNGRRVAFAAIFDITERLKAQEELSERNALLSEAQRIANMGAWKMDLRTGFLEWPKETLELFGISAEQFDNSYQGFRKLIHPDDQEQMEAMIHKAYQGGVIEAEYRIIRPDGSVRWMYERGSQQNDENDQPLRRIGVVMDITEKKRIEQELVASEERFRKILEDIPTVAVQGYALDGTVKYWNAASELVYGYTEEEALGGNLLDLIIPPELQDTVRGAIDHASKTGENIPSGELSLMRKDGSRVSVYSNHTIVKRAGSEAELYCVDIDLTEIEKLQRQLKDSEERFRLVAKATVDAVWDWDLVENTIWWGEAIETLFGYRRSELVPDISSWTDRIHPNDKGFIITDVERIIAGDSSRWEGSYRFRKANEQYAWVVDRGFVIRDENGIAIRMVGGMTDITEQRQLQEQLQQSQRLESIGQLTGGIAHDFNNLLTVILGNAELMIDILADQPNDSVLAEMIAQAARRGSELTHQLLAFARKQALDPKVNDVNRMLSEMDRLLRRTLGEHVEIEFVKGAGLWKALVDRAQLESAILNLCINARDAMPEGGRLTIETSNVQLDQGYSQLNAGIAEGKYVSIAVSDTGSGIHPEILGRVFEPFFTTKAEGRGSGLGLSMVYGFAKQSNGHVKIYSEIGEGTTVRLYIPSANEDAQVDHESVVGSEIRGGTERILVVEDDDLVRKFAVSQLTAFGYKVVEAANGPTALDIFKKDKNFDLLFTDIVMPGGMNGRQLADAILEIKPTLKVLYTSGYTSNAVVHHGRLDPGANLLGKPYGRKELARKIREVLAAK